MWRCILETVPKKAKRGGIPIELREPRSFLWF